MLFLQFTLFLSNIFILSHLNMIIRVYILFLVLTTGFLLQNKVQGFFFDVSMSSKFELAIMVLIILNMIAMMVEHYNQSQAVTDALDIINIIFTTIFTLEAVVKLIGLRWHYFRRAWNVFDFIIVLFSIVGK